MNPIIKLLLFSDVFIITGFGLVAPILAVFINEDLVGGNVAAAGMASAIFLVTKSLIQIPFSRYVDRHDDYSDSKWLLAGTILIVLVPLMYLRAENIQMLYLAQFIYGLGAGFAYPSWLGLWSTHIDKGRESFEWSLYFAVTGLGTALAAAGGATIAEFFGFRVTFSLVSVMALLGCAVLWYLVKKEKRARKRNRRRGLARRLPKEKNIRH